MVLQLYQNHVPDDYWHYCWEMERDSTWGDHVTLQAAADAYGVAVNILTSYQENCFIAISPKEPRSDRCLYLSFWAEVHYNSLYPAGDPPHKERLLGSKTLYLIFHPQSVA